MKTLEWAWKHVEVMKHYKLEVPTHIFRSHIGRIGELGDAALVDSLVRFYESLEETSAYGGRIEDLTYDVRTAHPRYFAKALRCYGLSIYLEAELRAARDRAYRRGKKIRFEDEDLREREWVHDLTVKLGDESFCDAWRRRVEVS